MTEPFALHIDPGNAFGGSDFEFRVTPDYADEVTQELREAGFYTDTPLEHASDRQVGELILVSLVKAAADLDRLSKLLATIFARHDNKHLVANGRQVDAKGYSAGELERILRALHESGQVPDEVDASLLARPGSRPPDNHLGVALLE